VDFAITTTRISFTKQLGSATSTALCVTCRAYWGKSMSNCEFPIPSAALYLPGSTINFLLLSRYSPEELHAMVDLKPEKKDED